MKIRTWLFCLLAALALPAAAQAAYRGRRVKILVPYGPGGATDIIARILAQRLTETLGQSFIVDNRPGANGNIALEAAAKAPPDGYTLLIGNVSTNTINENTFASQLTIKPSRDLAGIAKLVEIPHVIIANAAFAPRALARPAPRGGRGGEEGAGQDQLFLRRPGQLSASGHGEIPARRGHPAHA